MIKFITPGLQGCEDGRFHAPLCMLHLCSISLGAVSQPARPLLWGIQAASVSVCTGMEWFAHIARSECGSQLQEDDCCLLQTLQGCRRVKLQTRVFPATLKSASCWDQHQHNFCAIHVARLWKNTSQSLGLFPSVQVTAYLLMNRRRLHSWQRQIRTICPCHRFNK